MGVAGTHSRSTPKLAILHLHGGDIVWATTARTRHTQVVQRASASWTNLQCARRQKDNSANHLGQSRFRFIGGKMTHVPLRRLAETAYKFQDHHPLDLSCLHLRLAVLTERGTISIKPQSVSYVIYRIAGNFRGQISFCAAPADSCV